MIGSFRPEYMGRREEGILLGQLSNISTRSQELNPMPGSMSQGFEPGCGNFESGDNIIDLSFPRSTNHELGGPPHVAQQGRRDKLRILDGDSSPHAANQSSVPGFSTLMLPQASQSLTPQQTKNYQHPSTTRGLSGAGIGDEMPGVYDTHMMFTEMFNFPTGAELLGHVSPKGSAVLHQPPGCGDDGNVSASKINANPNLGNWKFVNGHQPQSNSDSPLNLVASKYNIPTASGSEHSMAIAGALQFNSLGVLKEGNMGLHDAMQLYLMNPAGNGDYSQSLIQANMLITSNGMGGHPAPEHHKHFVEHPLHFPTTFQQSVSAEAATVSNNGREGLSNVRESPWEGGANELLLLPDNHSDLQSNQLLSPQFNWTSRQVAGSLSGSQWSQNPLEGKVCDDRSHGQGLSLSLSSLQPNNNSSQMQPQALEGRIAFSSQDIFNRSNVLQGAKAKSEDLFNSKGLAAYFSSFAQNPSHRGSTMSNIGLVRGRANLLKNSKYLKPVQQLLIEFCNVGRGLKTNSTAPKQPDHRKTLDGSSIDVVQRRPCSTSTGWVPLAGTKVAGNGTATSSSAVPPATRNDGAKDQLHLSGDRFELQRRRTKLLSILDEVDRRYTHYCDQMQMVVTSFEAVAGIGAASPYTALALKAMSRHFRCLRDAISGQIRATSEALGEKDPGTISGVTRGETPRLRFLEQSLRQQRTLHQVGMLEQEAWRPQRGLPERSVSVLRAWLFEHFLHPYPSDADKHLLARQTGLSRSQVSNWFINARVRLWKPMVEEMYQEEAKEAEPGPGKDKSAAGKAVTSNDDNQMNTNGKMTDKQSIFQSEDGSKHELGGSPSVNTGQESSSATSLPLESQTLEANFDESSMPRKAIRGLDSASTIRTQMSSKHDHPAILDGLHDSRLFNQDKNIKIQGSGVAGLDFSSYSHNGSSIGTMYDGHRDLTNPTQFGTGDVSLTLGLRHSGAALSLPVADQQKYDNSLYLSRS